MSATTKPITAKILKEQLEPFLKALNNLYDELLEQNQSSDIFPEDDSIMTFDRFLELVRKVIGVDKLATPVRTSYDAFVQYLVNNKFLLTLANSSANLKSNIAILKEFNITFNFYEDTNSEFSTIEKLAQYKMYIPKWLKALGAVDIIYTSSKQGVSDLRAELTTITSDAYEKIGGTLCYSFFKLKRATQLKEERHDLIKRIFFELGLFISTTTQAESFFAKMVYASPPLVKWKAAVTVYSTAVYSAYSASPQRFNDVSQIVMSNQHGYISNAQAEIDNIFKSFQFKTILEVFQENRYIKYAESHRKNYIITMEDVANMRKFAESNNLTLFYKYDAEVYNRIATLFIHNYSDTGSQGQSSKKIKLEKPDIPGDIPILAPWLSVNGISSFIRENSSNDGMPIFASIFDDYKSVMQPALAITGDQFPKNIEFCCDKNKLTKDDTGTSSTVDSLCWICGCPIAGAKACDHFHAMLAMSILINIRTPQSPEEICKNFGYTHPGCNALKSQYPVSIIYGLIGTALFNTLSKNSGNSCIDAVTFRKAYFVSLSAFKPKPIKERVDFYMKSLIVKQTLIIFNKDIVKSLYTAIGVGAIQQLANTLINKIETITKLISEDSEDQKTDIAAVCEINDKIVSVANMINDETEKNIIAVSQAIAEGASVANMINEETEKNIIAVSQAIEDGTTNATLKKVAQKVQTTIKQLTQFRSLPYEIYKARFHEFVQMKSGPKIDSIPKLIRSQSTPETSDGVDGALDLSRLAQQQKARQERKASLRHQSQQPLPLPAINEGFGETPMDLDDTGLDDTGKGRIRKLRVNKQRTRRIKRKKQETIKRPKKSHVVSKKKHNLAYKRHNTLRLRKKFTTSKKIKKFKIR
jgi:hypothetical protein